LKVIIFIFVAIIFLFSFSINYFEEVFAEEELVCPVDEVAIVRVNNPKLICVDQNTAQKWAQLGITEIVGESIEEKTEEIVPELEGSPEDTMPKFRYTSIPNDFSRAQNYLVTISGGDMKEPITFQTFSKNEPLI